jgi:hypothetical protein
MFNFGDLFQWDRFVTPSVIKVFYALAVILSVLLGASGIYSAIQMVGATPIAAVFGLMVSLIGTAVGIVLSRIAAELALIMFRINEHLAAIRNRAEM